MENTIKQYKPVFIIKTFDNQMLDIQAESISKILDALNDKTNSFIKLSEDIIIAKNQIKSVEKLKDAGNALEEFIYYQSTGDLKKLYAEIFEERKTQKLKTNGISHLMEIAKNRKPHLFTT